VRACVRAYAQGKTPHKIRRNIFTYWNVSYILLYSRMYYKARTWRIWYSGKKEALTRLFDFCLLGVVLAIAEVLLRCLTMKQASTRCPPKREVPRYNLNWKLMWYQNLSTGNYLPAFRRSLLTPSSVQHKTIQGNKISQKTFILTKNAVEPSNWQRKISLTILEFEAIRVFNLPLNTAKMQF
jgi:hypothetical protein